MEGVALAAILPLWSYKSELLTPIPKAYITFLQKVTILAKAINKDKPLSSGVLPSRQQSCVCRLPGTPPLSVYQVTHGTALQAAECL